MDLVQSEVDKFDPPSPKTYPTLVFSIAIDMPMRCRHLANKIKKLKTTISNTGIHYTQELTGSQRTEGSEARENKYRSTAKKIKRIDSKRVIHL